MHLGTKSGVSGWLPSRLSTALAVVEGVYSEARRHSDMQLMVAATEGKLCVV
jgi:hypothetical protein